MKRILVTGPESTGKSELSGFLADHYKGKLIPEFARTYIEALDRPYNYEDVLTVAGIQLSEYRKGREEDGWIFFDTWLVITKVWMDVVFKTCPEWIDHELQNASFDLVLICAPDIPWEPDSVRENGGEERNKLFKRYVNEIDKLGWAYSIIKGTGEERYRNALNAIQQKQRGYGLF